MDEIVSGTLNIRREGDHRISADLFRGPEGCWCQILCLGRNFLFHLRGNLLKTDLPALLFNLFWGRNF